MKSVVEESEKYPLVSAFWDEAQQSVLDIQKHYAMNGGETLTNEEVLDQVEKTYKDFMDNAVQNEKVRSIYNISPSEKPLGEVQKSQSRTLSSKGTSRMRTSETKTGPVSKHEALERAVQAFRETKSGV